MTIQMGNTALHLAMKCNCKSKVELLLKYRTKRSLNIRNNVSVTNNSS